MVTCGARSWTRRSLWVPSNPSCSMILNWDKLQPRLPHTAIQIEATKPKSAGSTVFSLTVFHTAFTCTQRVEAPGGALLSPLPFPPCRALGIPEHHPVLPGIEGAPAAARKTPPALRAPHGSPRERESLHPRGTKPRIRCQRTHRRRELRDDACNSQPCTRPCGQGGSRHARTLRHYQRTPPAPFPHVGGERGRPAGQQRP